jgi:Peptidase family M23
MCSEHESRISIGPPLAGEWKFLRPPGHHPFAFDFVKTDSARQTTHSKSRLHFIFGNIPAEEYYCWKEPVVAPISGEILRVGDGWHDNERTSLWSTIRLWYNATYRFQPEMKAGVLEIRPNAGNHVMIKSDAGFIVFLAHFKKNSITVTQGQRVEQGERLGLVGNSGNSTAPHLHINLFDQMDDPYTAKVLPFVFTIFELQTSADSWTSHTESVPEAGSLIKFQLTGSGDRQSAQHRPPSPASQSRPGKAE